MLSITMQKELIRKYLQGIFERCDKGTWEHSVRVGKISKKIAQELRMSAQDVSQITLAGLLHDVGKVFIPEMINFPGKLGDFDRNVISHHPQMGSRFINIHWVNIPPQVLEGIILHHERLDGTGYPFKLKSNDIPLAARIVAVADVFDAMSSHRPYRPALSNKEIFKELSTSSYDQEIVYVLMKDLLSS